MLISTSAAALGSAIRSSGVWAADTSMDVFTPMAPPEWALLQRTLLEQQTDAIQVFWDRYFDPGTGYLKAVIRYGAADGPDDAIEHFNNWPQLYNLGGDKKIWELFNRGYEGNLRQFGEAKTVETPAGRQGMYFREFPAQMDWQHHAEGMTPFNVAGLGDPYDQKYRTRARRYAGFYIGEDPVAQNYDPKVKIIRSMINGSIGPLMRKATGLDWAGDPMDYSRYNKSGTQNTYEAVLKHFSTYTDVVGDHPLNHISTTLAFNAYALANEPKYKNWILEYSDAWLDRAQRNNDIVPSNIGLDGKIGGETGGKWYGGTYGWAFSINRMPFSILGWFTAYLVSGGNDKYLDVWRKMTDKINANSKEINGVMSAPYQYGDNGWFAFQPGKWQWGAQDIYLLTMKQEDRLRAPDHPFLLYLEGKNPTYPVTAMRDALAAVRRKVEQINADQTSGDNRFLNTVQGQNPATVSQLINLMEGGFHVGRPGWSNNSVGVGGALHYTRLRYFDPANNRPGVPKDVAALVSELTADSATVTLVNVGASEPRNVTIQGGAYGEHQIISVVNGSTVLPVNGRSFSVRLAPGAGTTLKLTMKRYANQPTLDFPWLGPLVDRPVSPAPAGGRGGRGGRGRGGVPPE